MARLSGENPYGRPIDVYRDKVEDRTIASAVPDDRAVTGNIMEAAIAKRYVHSHTTADYTMRILQTRQTYRHPQVSWALATPDRFVWQAKAKEHVSPASLGQRLASGGKADWLLECKLVGARAVQHWIVDPQEGDLGCDCIPPYVLVQVQWNMYVLDYGRVDVAALLNGTSFRSFTVYRDDAYIGALIAIGGEFWERNVLGRIPPPPDGSEAYEKYLTEFYPKGNVEIAEAPEGSEQLAREYRDFLIAEKTAKRQKEERGQALKMLIRERAGIRGAWGIARWSAGNSRIDWDQLALDHGMTPAEIERYRRPGGRVLRVHFEAGEEMF